MKVFFFLHFLYPIFGREAIQNAAFIFSWKVYTQSWGVVENFNSTERQITYSQYLILYSSEQLRLGSIPGQIFVPSPWYLQYSAVPICKFW